MAPGGSPSWGHHEGCRPSSHRVDDAAESVRIPSIANDDHGIGLPREWNLRVAYFHPDLNPRRIIPGSGLAETDCLVSSAADGVDRVVGDDAVRR
jgi:hypothetical protein